MNEPLIDVSAPYKEPEYPRMAGIQGMSQAQMLKYSRRNLIAQRAMASPSSIQAALGGMGGIAPFVGNLFSQTTCPYCGK